MTVNLQLILFVVAVVCFLLDAFRGPLRLQTAVSFTPLGFACVTAAIGLV